MLKPHELQCPKSAPNYSLQPSLKILDFFSKFWILIDDNLIKKLKRIS